ncbi:AAA family ATPase [Trichlorobacter ammonificans]|uniref:AAA family ATPase n=1 Tax=Trichlorobacter ammonificans TaxID=2916410 RepID=A0ABN8HI29_9BACT|nr:AAA family ATPase [Trichlorobacter ammonificans]CAH2030922.1 AAA family ATPase [Trichlorobacter ammonificans]
MSERSNAIGNTLAELSSSLLQGKREPLRLAMVALLTGGHLLIEDLPGLGKTTLALALAGSIGLSLGRIQCTSDLLPSDITGLSIFRRDEGRFEFLAGPVFNNIVLVDEINRAMPRTQSALLEAMEERRVTIEGNTHLLPDPFLVIATQNPVEQTGTYPLPESQLDRFLLCTGIGYPPAELEKAIIAGGGVRERLEGLPRLLTATALAEARREVAAVTLSATVVAYLHTCVTATRHHPAVQIGLSTRAAIGLAAAARAAAYLDGRDFVAPEDVREMAAAVGAHRLFLRPHYDTLDRRGLLRSIIDPIPLPLA